MAAFHSFPCRVTVWLKWKNSQISHALHNRTRSHDQHALAILCVHSMGLFFVFCEIVLHVISFCFVSNEPKPSYPSLSKPCYITDPGAELRVLKLTANSNISQGAENIQQPLVSMLSFIIWCLYECQNQMRSIYHLSAGMSAELSIDHLDRLYYEQVYDVSCTSRPGDLRWGWR